MAKAWKIGPHSSSKAIDKMTKELLVWFKEVIGEGLGHIFFQSTLGLAH